MILTLTLPFPYSNRPPPILQAINNFYWVLCLLLDFLGKIQIVISKYSFCPFFT